jgi:methylmalonyl-CoA mutase cobalamin-binding domain/chain
MKPAARRRPSRPVAARRIVTGVPLCDGHDSAITTINLELVRHGWEVVYLGYHQAASAIARAAVQEDAHAIGLSSYNGGHVVFFREVLAQLGARSGKDILVYGGGGGTITAADAEAMRRAGVRRVFFAGTSLGEMADVMNADHARARPRAGKGRGDRELGRAISLAEDAPGRAPLPARSRGKRARGQSAQRPFVVGFAGPGGAGKSTLIDELTARFLRARPDGRIAVLANDPSHPDGGALLGDRVSAIYAQDERVFFRSLATRGSLSGVSSAAPAAVRVLAESGQFDLVFVESVGIGQESDPFGVFAGATWVDAVAFVLSPHYGGRIQLQKIALLEAAELVVLNKCDDHRAKTAVTELTTRLAANRKGAALYGTIAADHADPGVDALFAALLERARRAGSTP